MRIVLVGFSGTGKSYWSGKLDKECGYSTICCDDGIERRLEQKLPEGASGISDVAEWMGQPYEEGYKAREAEYLKCEIAEMNSLLAESAADYPDNTVVDTGGSVIYTGESVLEKLSAFGTVVYLEVTSEVLEEMFQLYMKEPKPVVWGESFSQEEGESASEALRRSYIELMGYRQKKYAEIADVVLPYDELRRTSLSAAEFVKLIESKS